MLLPNTPQKRKKAPHILKTYKSDLRLIRDRK
jgi:hypothetical protein